MKAANHIGNELYRIQVEGSAETLWSYRLESSGETYAVSPPVFEIDGRIRETALSEITETVMLDLANGSREYRLRGSFRENDSLRLEIVFRVAPNNPVVRFRYRLLARETSSLTKQTGEDNIVYARIGFGSYSRFREIRLADFDEFTHQYGLTDNELRDEHFDNGTIYAGPLTVATGGGHAAMLAYEHGSQSTDLYVGFQADASRQLTLRGVKGNYCHGDRIDAETGYRTLWMQFAAVQRDAADLAEAYRMFALRHFSDNASSRSPYIFYNTWNFQERNRYWNKRTYLASMNLEHILSEIDVAYRMGIEVYVIDMGWFIKSGDWDVSLERFPDGLSRVKERLDGYGMKLGLWFDPKAVALTSQLYRTYEHCIVSWDGVREAPHPIWETEESVRMCLVSPYGQAFADKLIELAKRLGVVYFKWDAISQYGCNDPGHDHGDGNATAEERGHRFAFQLVLKLVEIAKKVSEAIPEAIIDFDVTEGYRCVGLSFLEAGKYFLINNGPYYPNFDVPRTDPGEFYNYNVFFQPGPSRSMLCRSAYAYDKWIPSVLFLVHYFPDDFAPNQNISVASLILGHNGIWGDLLGVSEEGVERIGRLLSLYKQVRDDITTSYPVTGGGVGRTPEAYEKVNPENGRGVAVLFASSFGQPFDRPRPVKSTYITSKPVDRKIWHPSNVEVSFDSKGRAVIEASFTEADAAIVFFGVEGY